MQKRPSSYALIALGGFMLTGCSSLQRSVDPGITREQCDFEVNKAHYHDVLDELGPPARLSAAPGGFAFIYEALEIDEKQLGLSRHTRVQGRSGDGGIGAGHYID